MARGNKRKRDGGGRGGGSGGGGGDDGRSNKRAYHRNTSHHATQNTIAGPGVFLTTTRTKERKAALQLMDILEEHSQKLYPDVKLKAYVPADRDASTNRPAKKALTEEDEEALFNGAGGDDAGDDDADENETEAEPIQGEQQAAVPAPAAAEELDDIQAQIRAELAELGASSKAQGGGAGGAASHAKGKGEPLKLFRFGVVTQNLIDCVAFVRVTPPQDPHRLVYSVLEEVERTGGARCRFVQRLTPVTDTCSANYDSIAILARRVLPQYFTADQPRTYRIEPRIRAHNVVTRDSLIQQIGEQVPKDQGHSVNLKEPELVIVVEVLKNVCGVGVAEHWSRFKRFNPAMIAEEVNKQRGAAASLLLEQGSEAGLTSGEGRVAAAQRQAQTQAQTHAAEPASNPAEGAEVPPASALGPKLEAKAEPTEDEGATAAAAAAAAAVASALGPA
ncbi:hypothetical protein OC834_000471 [Tilletia horrida]|nr:hypothetical protein OC834_000471 [Tilletia horrida]